MEKIKLKDFLDFTFLSNVESTDNKDKTVFLSHKCNEEENNYKTNLWIYDHKSKLEKDFSSLGNIDTFSISEGEGILYSTISESDYKEDVTQLHFLPWDDTKAEKRYEIPLNVKILGQLNDEIYVLSGRVNLEIMELTKGKTEEDKYEILEEYKEGRSRYTIYDEYPFWLNGEGIINKTRVGLFLFNIKENKLKKITNKFMDVENVVINKRLKKIAYFGSEYRRKSEFYKGIYIYSYENNETQCIVKPNLYRMRQLDFLGENIVFAASDMKRYGYSQCQDILMVNIEGGEVETIYSEELSVGNSINSDSRYGSGQYFKVYNDKIYLIITEGEHSNIISIDEKGSLSTETNVIGSVNSFDIANNRINYISMKDMKLQEIYSYDLNIKKTEQITKFNESFYNSKNIIKPEKLYFTNDKGMEIHGLILKPTDFNKDKKYPAILNIHGGPKTAYGEVYFHEMQVLANMGYLVFFCNPRGSDGRGDEFAHLRGKFGDIDYEDIMEFTDKVVDKYKIIDKDKIAVVGGSYGGFLVNYIIGHTNRFTAAISQRSISNFITHESVSDLSIESTRGHMLASVRDNYIDLWNKSPLKYAHKVNTPTLFIHADEDYRCHHVEALQMFTALRYHGVDSRLCLFKKENHELSRSGKPGNRIKRLVEIINWIEKYLNE